MQDVVEQVMRAYGLMVNLTPEKSRLRGIALNNF
jgi:hypothetical protein